MSNNNRLNKDIIISASSLVLLFISTIPVLVLGFFNYATGDDLGYGAPGRAVLRSGGNIIDFLSAAVSDTVREYYSWGGNWASGFLHRFEPSIFGERFYSITAVISILSLTLPSFFLLLEIMVRKFGLKMSTFITIYSLMTILLIQYMPAPRGGIYWFTGITVYTLPFGFCLISLLMAIHFTDTGKFRYLIPCSLLTIYIGGSGYPEFVLAAMILFFQGMYTLLLKKAPRNTVLLKGETSFSRKRGFFLIIPLATLCISFLISAVSPGNALRSGSGLTPGPERIINTITGSLIRGLTDPVKWVSEIPLIAAFILLAVVFTAETFKADDNKGPITFRRPYLMIPVLYLTYCFTYAPELYAGEEVASGFSGGVYDTYYFTFMICLTLAAVYLTCFVKTMFFRRASVPGDRRLPELRGILFGVGLFACILLAGRLFDNTVDYTCIKFAMSGQLSDFDSQMKERIGILEDTSVADAVVPEMNDSQGPFMHMPLLSDPTAFTNQVTARFYGKNSVTAVPREEFKSKNH